MIPNVTAILSASSAVTAITADRIYRTVAPQAVTKPYIVWSIISAVPENTLGCSPEIDDRRIQIDCFATSQVTARQLSDAAQVAIEGKAHVIMGPIEDYEPETKLYHWYMDATFWTPR